jgi:hypothetical protein
VLLEVQIMSMKYFTEGGTTEGGIPFNVHEQTMEYKGKIKSG